MAQDAFHTLGARRDLRSGRFVRVFGRRCGGDIRTRRRSAAHASQAPRKPIECAVGERPLRAAQSVSDQTGEQSMSEKRSGSCVLRLVLGACAVGLALLGADCGTGIGCSVQVNGSCTNDSECCDQTNGGATFCASDNGVTTCRAGCTFGSDCLSGCCHARPDGVNVCLSANYCP